MTREDAIANEMQELRDSHRIHQIDRYYVIERLVHPWWQWFFWLFLWWIPTSKVWLPYRHIVDVYSFESPYGSRSDKVLTFATKQEAEDRLNGWLTKWEDQIRRRLFL